MGSLGWVGSKGDSESVTRRGARGGEGNSRRIELMRGFVSVVGSLQKKNASDCHLQIRSDKRSLIF